MPMKVYKPANNNKQQKSEGKKIFGTFIVLFIIVGFILSAWFLFQILNPMSIKETHFTISPGEGVNQISSNLKEQGIIKNQFVFETYIFLKGIQADLKAGEYNLPSLINIKRLAEIFVIGEPSKEWQLTVIEGWTIKDIASQMESLGKFQAEDLLKATGLSRPMARQSIFDAANYDFLRDKPDKASLEGYLFPDTYRFFTYATIEDVVRKMLNNFDKKLTPQMRADILKQDKTIFDIITMASIIEREVTTKSDREIVSGIFWKRLNAGIALQADSTINYITGKKTPAVSAEDLAIDSLYNTYKYPGLPPGPISNPGLDAIKAAIYPQESGYWYFLTDKEGRVHYAENFQKHKENKLKYLP